MADDRNKPSQDRNTKDLPPKPIKETDDRVKGGMAKPQVDASKKIM